MEVNQLVAHYKANYERKVFMTRLSHAMQNAYLMYIYDYPSELKNFADTFLAYLPFYIRNSDYFETVDENEDIDTQLITRSKNMRKNSKIIPHRQIASDGIYGELFLDFYLRIVNGRKAVITYVLNLNSQYILHCISPLFDRVLFYYSRRSVFRKQII